MNKIKLLLVDDSPVFAVAAMEFLAGDHGLELLPVAGSGSEALERIEGEVPDVVLMDLHMPTLNGLEATRRIKSRGDAPRVILISLDDSAENRSAAEVAGADAFLGKERVCAELPALIRQLAKPGGRK